MYDAYEGYSWRWYQGSQYAGGGDVGGYVGVCGGVSRGDVLSASCLIWWWWRKNPINKKWLGMFFLLLTRIERLGIVVLTRFWVLVGMIHISGTVYVHVELVHLL